MQTSSATTTDEVRRPGKLPLWEIPGWRERFGVVAGITGRGDDPDRPFDLGLWSQQPVGEVMNRWHELQDALPEFPGQVLARQVHGTRVLWHRPTTGWTLHDSADGHATSSEGTLLLVTVADCVPIYLMAPTRRAVALLHSGWRGSASSILRSGVDLLRERLGVQPAELVMHAGVAISGARYEVGREVVEALGGEATGQGPWHVDLRDHLVRQAVELGIGEVSRSSHCSAANNESFFSHRQSDGHDGRMVALLGLLPTADKSD